MGGLHSRAGFFESMKGLHWTDWNKERSRKGRRLALEGSGIGT